MKILIACEESQRVCTAFRERGHDAFSCDVQKQSGGHPEWHIQQNVLELIDGNCEFDTGDNVHHIIDKKWDLIIAHPPCTFLTAAGSRWLYDRHHHIYDLTRYGNGLLAADFFMQIFNADCERICIENPLPMRVWNLPLYTQIIHPYFFGESYSKRTCLWLRGLQKLRPTHVVSDNVRSWTELHSSSKMRSKTFYGVAYAMALQWG